MEKMLKKNYLGSNMYIVFKMTILLLIVFVNAKAFGQGKVKKEIEVPIEVKTSFEKQYPNVNAIWNKEYRGNDDDQLRYEAKFSGNKGNNLAVYDNLGNLKAFEASIALNELPAITIDYLKKGYLFDKVTETVKVTDMDVHPDTNADLDLKYIITYEVGVMKNGTFYDLVFSDKGEFIRMVEKN